MYKLLLARYVILLSLCGSVAVTSAQQDTASNAALQKAKGKGPWIASAVLLASGSVAALDDRILDRYAWEQWQSRQRPPFQHAADDILPFLPLAAVYLCDVAGARPRTNYKDRTLILLKSGLATLVSVHALKRLTAVPRPDSSDHFSFPSGHTASAFMAATVLHHELGDRSVFYSIAGYGVATLTGVLRMQHNRHWASDVLAGAGIGILCTEWAYRTHRYRWAGKKDWSLLPYWGNGRAGIYLNWRL